MEKNKCYDIFITHAWRFHDDWKQFSELMDKEPSVTWRNFSLPWHDPAMNANTEIGGRFIKDFLETQIIPAHVVILLTGVYSIASARRWFDLEVEMARKHNKPMIGIPAIGEESVPDEVAKLCDANGKWDPLELLKIIDQVRNRPKFLTKIE